MEDEYRQEELRGTKMSESQQKKKIARPKVLKNTKGKYVTVTYYLTSKFVFPDGFEPNMDAFPSDENDNWFVKWDELYVKDKDGKWRKGRAVFQASVEPSFKRPDSGSAPEIEEEEYLPDEKHTMESLEVDSDYE